MPAAGVSVRFAVVGCGNAAQRIHLPALRAEGADITVFASRSRASAEKLRDEWGDGIVAERWEDAIERDDVDAVVIAVPNSLHRDVAIAAATSGKHVLVDKPMACTTEDADDMIAAANAHRVVLVPFQNTRFAAPFVAAQRFVAAGRLGEVTGFRAAFGHAGPQTWAPRGEWFFDSSRAGGGCLIDLGVHAIDLVRCVTGDDIAAVSALVNGCRGDVEADAQLLARMRGGAIGSIHASWSSPAGPDQQLTVIGREGPCTSTTGLRSPSSTGAASGSALRCPRRRARRSRSSSRRSKANVPRRSPRPTVGPRSRSCRPPTARPRTGPS